jgi:hypothetical protein
MSTHVEEPSWSPNSRPLWISTLLYSGAGLRINGHLKSPGDVGSWFKEELWLGLSGGSVTFPYLLGQSWTLKEVEQGRGELPLAKVLVLLEFGTSECWARWIPDNIVFCLPSFELHWQPDGIMNSLRSNAHGPRMCWFFASALSFNSQKTC